MKSGPLILALLAGFGVSVSSAAEPRIPNRAPNPDEVGYRPADGSVVALNPPSFIWLHEPAAVTYTVEWADNREFKSASTAQNIPWNTYTHRKELPPGTWWWRYRFTNKAGETSNWSEVRSVVVLSSATVFPMPTRAEQRERVPAGHPRLFHAA